MNIHFSKYHIWKPSLRPQKRNGFNFARVSPFFVHFFAVTAWLWHESAYFMICGGRKHNTMTFFFFSWTLEKFANIWLPEWDGISLKQCEFTFKWCLHKLPIFSAGARTWSKIMSHHLLSLIGQLSFLLSTKNGNCDKEYLRALDKTNIRQLHVSAPYEFLVRSNYAVIIIFQSWKQDYWYYPGSKGENMFWDNMSQTTLETT